MPGCAGLRGRAMSFVILVIVAGLIGLGCQSDPTGVEPSIAAYRDRMLVADHQRGTDQEPGGRRPSTMAVPVASQPEQPQRAALIARPAATSQPAPSDVLSQIPDPTDAPALWEARLRVLREAAHPDARVIKNREMVTENALRYLQTISKPQQVRLSLTECIQRALEHNYAIRIDAYNPAISQTQLVEAEAAFDAEMFLNFSNAHADPATTRDIGTPQTDTLSYSGGIRKLLATGMTVSTSVGQQRSKIQLQRGDLPITQLNPTWNSTFDVNFTQPLLRNFGIEVNRANINIARANWDIAYEQFIATVRDTLLNVETAYWQLVLNRRTGAVLAETVAQNYVTYVNMWERQGHDATEVELQNSKSSWRQREVQFQEAVKNIRDAEDTLKNLINDPNLKLSQEQELITADVPLAAALAVDQLAAVRTALDTRSEIRQSRRRIDQSRISAMLAKNQTLPQLDVTFQYEVQGLGGGEKTSFDNLTTNRFISYTVSAVFSYPLGNRAREAAYRRARLQEGQAVETLYQVTDGIVQEVNGAVRLLQVRYAQIPPQLEAVNAAERNLQALQARTQRIDPSFLQTELGAVEQLSSTRTTLAQVLASYNNAIVALEKAKGTLLKFDNVVVTDEPPER